MALLTRSRRRSDPAAEALDRAREVSTEAFERATDAAEWARDAAEPRIAQVREAAEPRIAQVREAAEPRIAQVREAAEPRIAKVREAAEPRIAEVREASAPALAQARRGLGALLRLLVRLVALLPDIGARVLGTVAVVLGRLADRSAEVANVEPPSRTAPPPSGRAVVHRRVRRGCGRRLRGVRGHAPGRARPRRPALAAALRAGRGPGRRAVRGRTGRRMTSGLFGDDELVGEVLGVLYTDDRTGIWRRRARARGRRRRGPLRRAPGRPRRGTVGARGRGGGPSTRGTATPSRRSSTSRSRRRPSRGCAPS